MKLEMRSTSTSQSEDVSLLGVPWTEKRPWGGTWTWTFTFFQELVGTYSMFCNICIFGIINMSFFRGKVLEKSFISQSRTEAAAMASWLCLYIFPLHFRRVAKTWKNEKNTGGGSPVTLTWDYVPTTMMTNFLYDQGVICRSKTL